MTASVHTITRFAPSPTGFLHLGHVASALYVWGLSRIRNGRVLLRIEDHDQSRCREEYIKSIYADLEWLGLVPDEEVAYQSKRQANYQLAFEKLKKIDLVYACTCSRRDLILYHDNRKKNADHEFLSDLRFSGSLQDHELSYPGFCGSKHHPFTTPNSGARFRVCDEEISFEDLFLGKQIQNPALQCGDFLLKDRGGHWTYQFCVVVDDLEQGVNLIVRGQDLTASTARQLQLAKVLGRKETLEFAHHPLITGPDGRKLSKRFFSQSIGQLRRDGISAAQLIGDAAYQSGILCENKPASLTQVWEEIANKAHNVVKKNLVVTTSRGL